jgi:nitrogen regulatory protein PII
VEKIEATVEPLKRRGVKEALHDVGVSGVIVPAQSHRGSGRTPY